MKKSIFFFIGLFLSSTALTQPCLPEGIQFTTQAEVDSFPINHPNCTQIEGNVIIGNFNIQSNISNLNGLIGITAIGGRLTIFYTNNLSNLTGLNALSSIGSDLVIQSNTSLTSLTGFTSLSSIGGYIDVYSNNALTSFSGLNALSSVGGYIEIYFNNTLTSLTGLDNIDANTINGLFIWYNPSLLTCEVQSVCNYLASPTGDLHIFGNSPGCNSEVEVEAACAALSVDNLTNHDLFSLYPNPASTCVTIEAITTSPVRGLSILNLDGQELIQRQLTERQTLIDISNLPSGVYFVQLTSDKKVEVGKIVKQ